MRLQDNQRFDVIAFCTNYLFEKFSNEKGLFRSAVSQTDVRLLQTQIVQRNVTFRDEIDPHIVAEVLQTSLRDLTTPLFYEVYKDILNTELIEDDFDVNKSSVQKWILKLPDTKFEIANQLFRLLNRLAAMEENEASLMQLAYSISPAICRPLSSAYMSIRHMEDLKKIRPVILFLIENHSEIFSINCGSQISSANPSSKVIPLADFGDQDKTGVLSDIMASAMIIDSHKAQLMDQKGEHPTTEFPFVKPNLLVMIPTTGTSTSDTSTTSSVEMEADDKPTTLTHSYSDSEWKVLYALVNAKVGTYMDFEEKEIGDFVAAEANTDAHHVFMQSWTARVTSMLNSSNTKNEPTNAPGSPTGGSIGLSGKSPANLTKSYGRRLHRRRMVADCKALRAQIYEFEQEFAKKYNRQPKAQDRGLMQTVYSKYRDLKREIRDSAATDIQRVIRGYAARNKLVGENRIFFRRVKSTSGHVSNSSAMEISSSSGNNTEKGNKAGAKDASDGSSNGSSSGDVFTKFRDLLEQKKELKKKLKKFDEDFLEQNGRQPKKADKEVIRPMYQKYHELKNSIDSLKKVALATNLPIPEDLAEELLGGMSGTQHWQRSTSNDSKRTYGIGSGSKDDLSDMDSEDKSVNKGKSGSKSALSDDEGSHFEPEWNGKVQAPTSGLNLSTLNIQSMTAAEKSRSLDQLLQEKKNLHAYLKVYERDFNRSHGRPVMKNEDILPVANEYQRYKELKNLIKELKA